MRANRNVWFSPCCTANNGPLFKSSVALCPGPAWIIYFAQGLWWNDPQSGAQTRVRRTLKQYQWCCKIYVWNRSMLISYFSLDVNVMLLLFIYFLFYFFAWERKYVLHSLFPLFFHVQLTLHSALSKMVDAPLAVGGSSRTVIRVWTGIWAAR